MLLLREKGLMPALECVWLSCCCYLWVAPHLMNLGLVMGMVVMVVGLVSLPLGLAVGCTHDNTLQGSGRQH
jgi:hypothetical protein